MDIDWTQNSSQCTDIEEMWLLFKDRLMDGVVQYVPEISQFYDWRKPYWRRPLSANIRIKIKNKHMLWKQYLVSRNIEFLHKYKRLCNQIQKITRCIHKAEQNEVARWTKTNPKKSFCNYFSSVFTIYDVATNNVDDVENVILNETDLEIFLSGVEFNDFSILKALDELNIYKSPCPDCLHPRILYETRNVISVSLRIIFEASMRMKQLPKDWINANICAVHKKRK